MSHDFDQLIDRRSTGSIKWQLYGPNVLPMWVADMDFSAPQPIIDALHRQVATGEFGYSKPSNELGELICARLAALYGWQVTPEQIVYIPSLVTGIHAACRSVGESGEGVLMQTPVYPPFLSAPASHDRVAQFAPLTLVQRDNNIGYDIDFTAFEAAITEATERTALFLLCNPHNPTGVAYSREDQQHLAEICLRHNVVICSDEIHCDLLLGDTQHVPIASISPEIANQTITMMAPSKTFNVPGLKASFVVIPNADLRQRFTKRTEGIVPWVNNLGFVAMHAAYRDCDGWLQDLRVYLAGNRDAYVAYINEHLPQLRTTVPSATYLGWIDCREAGIPGDPYKFFLEKAGVALNDGSMFGAGGEGFVRLNFGCPRATLLEGLGKIRNALEDL
jgi:cysteine-S-conjugate beta-lyase